MADDGALISNTTRTQRLAPDGSVSAAVPVGGSIAQDILGNIYSEGIQKFLYPAAIGAGRFAKIGIPSPELMGPLVGVIEITCGALVLVGLLTRLATLPLIGVMVVAIVSTKIPILLGEGLWGFELRKLPGYGFWSMAHEARTDFSMLLGSIFLLIVGPGPTSLDERLADRWTLVDRTRRGEGETGEPKKAKPA